MSDKRYLVIESCKECPYLVDEGLTCRLLGLFCGRPEPVPELCPLGKWADVERLAWAASEYMECHSTIFKDELEEALDALDIPSRMESLVAEDEQK